MSEDRASIHPAASSAAQVAVIGAGSIGAAFALTFADGGLGVTVQDSDPAARSTLKRRIADSLADLDSFGLCAESVDAILQRISVVDDIAEAVGGSIHVQECVPEDLDLKRRVFAELDAVAAESTTIASASSAIPCSDLAGGLAHAERCLVAHPGNPPYLLRVVEVVPAPFTAKSAIDRVLRLLESVRLVPVLLRREVRGFVFNRLQGAVLREAYCLVRDGVVGVEDLDRIVRDGLGLRWAVTGPFETADLNRRGGIAAHAKIMAAAYAEMGAERARSEPWTEDLVAAVAAERRALLPLDRWDERVRWRDRALMTLLASR